MRPQLFSALLVLTTALAPAVVTGEPEAAPLRVVIAAPAEDSHVAWRAARALERAAKDRGLVLTLGQAPLTKAKTAPFDLIVMPVRSLAARVPAFEVLELPYFYPSLGAVHANLDGELGRHLADAASAADLHLATIWDDGMHVISGLKRFDWLRNIKGREFLFTRLDPVGERTIAAWRGDVRRINPQDRDTVLRECLIANRATTPTEALREQLYRVHLSLSPTDHRYEGWVVVAPRERWTELEHITRKALEQALIAIRDWQREDARAGTEAALTALRDQGMIVYTVDTAERAAFAAALPEWPALLSDTLSAAQKAELIELASAGTATFPRSGVPIPTPMVRRPSASSLAR